MVDRSKLYSVSELAQEFSLTPQALRFYEEKGLLKPARSGRSRVYTYREQARLVLILRLRRVGFTLEDIAEYLGLYGRGGGQIVYGLEKIRARVADLVRMRSEIDTTIAELQGMEREALAKLAALDAGEAEKDG
jgi:DNA-binding transcriptional MerR regulator